MNTLLSELGLTGLLVSAACVSVAWKIIDAIYLSPLRSVPGPLLSRLTGMRAHVFGFMGKQARLAVDEYEKYGDIYVFQPNAVSIANPADIKRVLSSPEFCKASLYESLDFFGVQNTFSARCPQFASMRRRQLGPYFSSAYLLKMEKAILENGIIAIKREWDGLLQDSKGGQIEVNYHRTLLYASFDTIGNLAFGKRFDSLKSSDPKIEMPLKLASIYLGMQILLPILRVFPFSLAILPLKHQYEKLSVYSSESYNDRRALLAMLEKKGELDKKPADLLQGLIDCQDPESKIKMSSTEVHAESQIILGAGSETGADTLMWTIHLLMLYPDCYKRAVEEARSAFDKDHLITYSEAKAKLPYIEACIYESLRRLPATGGQLPRVVPGKGISIGGHFIPGGAVVNINVAGANHNKEYWNEPYLYDPTRFLNNDEAKRNVFTFSYGVRVCPGKQLAWIEMLTILANILKDYDMRLPDDYTLHGPHVLDKHGYPKPMDSALFLTLVPANAERDCRLVVSKRC